MTFGFIVLFFYPILWCINSGSNGSIPYFMYLFLIFIVVTSKRNGKIFFGSLFLLVNILLLFIEKYYPQYIVSYPSPKERFVDLSASISLSFIAIYATFETFLSSYKNAIKKVELQNIKLQENNIQIKKQKDELKNVNAEKNQLFNIIAHDLRSPFNGILGMCDMILEDIDNMNKEEITEYLECMQKSSKRTYQLLEDLLSWAQVQREGINFTPSPIHIEQIVSETFTLFEQQIKCKQLEVNHTIPENMSVIADNKMINTVIRNLVANAIKYTKSRGKINISCKTIDNNISITVSDSGIGMDENTRNTLFKIGEINSLLGTNGEQGTGFGLLICKEFIEKHGGNIQVESQMNEGSHFTFTIPLKHDNNSHTYQTTILKKEHVI